MTITRELTDGTKIDELREQFPGHDRAKALTLTIECSMIS